MISCTRKLHFDSAHRIVNHESKCKYVHGHRYVVDATFAAKELDDLGRIVDFGVIKEKLGKWVDDNWDHNIILWEKDKSLGDVIEKQTDQKVFYLPTNPTAENIADYLLNTVCKELFFDSEVECVKIKVFETPNCYAEAV
ncbi:MAG: 6-carboxytetrahydropterin synthase [Rickettsiales bacterium]|nr:6-carboxytetrahydropterin synthase [Pseudomonadota bacterium]MDA0966673.1 6-carboxytetrahydropterin synthase [Pseudomonadota bacterium]MDG4543701.1 6-carboxytetrahydropterin synthase [Rickettsiales bacterium]MDG4545848.1 6-carboxytetrahydropterin synthase [Rickettsiales bacterium]MDG4547378.1 6-carboxytetrahydropterin synthase [Rickettsiales bacterium]